MEIGKRYKVCRLRHQNHLSAAGDIEDDGVHVLSLQYRFKPISIDPNRAMDVNVHHNEASVTIPTTGGNETDSFQGKALTSTCEFILSHVPGKGCTLSKIDRSIQGLMRDEHEKDICVATSTTSDGRSTNKRLQSMIAKKKKKMK